MKTVRKQTNVSLREKGSKFIGFLFQAGSTGEFEELLGRIESKYPDATHHCYAYRIDPVDLSEFAQDDGEPGGTAGLPILNRLKSHDIVNAGLVVVRYYGGTNLGKSGLIRMYGETAERCLEKAEFSEITQTLNLRIIYPYNRQNQIDRLRSDFGLIELDSEYLEEVTLRLACPIENAEQLKAALDRMEHLEIRYEILGKNFITS